MNEPTSHQDGKARVVKFLKEKYGYERVIMVGDGSTDLASCPPAVSFKLDFIKFYKPKKKSNSLV